MDDNAILSADADVSPVGASTFSGEDLNRSLERLVGTPSIQGIPARMKTANGWQEGTLKVTYQFVAVNAPNAVTTK